MIYLGSVRSLGCMSDKAAGSKGLLSRRSGRPDATDFLSQTQIFHQRRG
jgi:hypothetical protein